MNLIQLLLSESLRNRNPQFDLQGSDKRLLRTASEDLMNYFMFHWKLTSQEITQLEFTERIRRYLIEEPEELKEFLKIWSGLWMKKWNERVKPVTETKESQRLEKNRKRLDQAEPLWNQLRNRIEIKDILTEALIRNGEICGTSILAEHLLKTELASTMERKNPTNSLQDLLYITNKALKRARNLSRTKGKTIFVITRKPRLK
jgi:hypothetical protein